MTTNQTNLPPLPEPDWYLGPQPESAPLFNQKTLQQYAQQAVEADRAARAQQVPDWIRVIDEELISTHLGVACTSHSYETAKQKLNELIAWYIAVATDPAVNGGFVLVPVEPTDEIIDAMTDAADAFRVDMVRAYNAMLSAAPSVPTKEGEA